MPKYSAGLLMFRRISGEPEVFLVHPGGPFWAAKDKGSWTIPKGEYTEEEQPLTAARREFAEETGFTSTPEIDAYTELGTIRQKSGKLTSAWSVEGDCDPSQLVSNHCLIEWPPRSGKQIDIPEVDRGQWFSIADAYDYIRAEQREFLTKLESILKP